MLRDTAAWRTPLVDAEDPGRLELIVATAVELLRPAGTSAWADYLASLPKADGAAPPCSSDAAAAFETLKETEIGAALAADQAVQAGLEALLGSRGGATSARCELGEMFATLLESLRPPSEAAARQALLHTIGLVATRAVAGFGLVPFFDLFKDNGAPTGQHNAAIECTHIASSNNHAAEALPCVAALSSWRILKGGVVLLAYGAFSAADFVYRYGCLPPEDEGAAHEVVTWHGPSLIASLSAPQRAVLESYGCNAAAVGLDAEAPSCSNFALPLAEAAKGQLPPLLRQLATVACCNDEDQDSSV